MYIFSCLSFPELFLPSFRSKFTSSGIFLFLNVFAHNVIPLSRATACPSRGRMIILVFQQSLFPRKHSVGSHVPLCLLCHSFQQILKDFLFISGFLCFYYNVLGVFLSLLFYFGLIEFPESTGLQFSVISGTYFSNIFLPVFFNSFWKFNFIHWATQAPSFIFSLGFLLTISFLSLPGSHYHIISKTTNFILLVNFIEYLILGH